MFRAVQAEFSCGFCTDAQGAQTIGKTFREKNYLLDTHTAVACTVLEGMGITRYQVVDRDTRCIYERLHDGGAITMALAQAGVQTTGITVRSEALEDYYLNLTGGGRHA